MIIFLTHLNLSFLPIFIWFIFFLVFNFLCYMFSSFTLYWVIFILIGAIFMFFFSFIYTSENFNYSFLQFFGNSQFFIYFVVSEVFFFAGIFWGLFWIIFSYDSCLMVSILVINPWGLALFNTFLLLLSSTYGVLFHIKFLNWSNDISLLLCILMGLFFIFNQYLEFSVCLYSISDFSYCSIFFLGTGFHGFHVFVGLVMLLLCLISVLLSNVIHFLLNCCLLYWHFVDIIWLFLFSILYCIVFNLYV